MRNLRTIQWAIDGESDGHHERQEESAGPARRVTLRRGVGAESSNQSWLVFDRPSPGEDTRHPVEVAYSLTDDEPAKIQPTADSQLVVFFPTEQPTHMGFLIQGPYRTTPARDNIPHDDPWNKQLLEETAKLVADSLSHLKSIGLLTIEALQAMPIAPEHFSDESRFRCIFDAVRLKLRWDDCIPKEGGGFVSGEMARLARSPDLLSLLGPEDLQALFGPRGSKKGQVQWASTNFPGDRQSGLRKYLLEQLGTVEVHGEVLVRQLSDEFLAEQPDEWMGHFYAYLAGQEALWKENRYRRPPLNLSQRRIARLADGSTVAPLDRNDDLRVYLPGPKAQGRNVLSPKCLEDREARSFFENLGVQPPDEIAEILNNVLPMYSENGLDIPDELHRAHIRMIVQGLRTDSTFRGAQLRQALQETPFLRCRNAVSGTVQYKKPSSAIRPTREVEILFEGFQDCWFLLEDQASENDLDDLLQDISFGNFLYGRTADDDGNVVLRRRHSDHQRGLDGFDPGAELHGLAHAVSHPNLARSKVVWGLIADPVVQTSIRGVVETSRRKTFEDSKKSEVYSTLGNDLMANRWLPDKDGNFCLPSDLGLEDLPDGFNRHESLATKLGMKGSERLEAARRAGIDPDDLELLTKLKQFPGEMAQVRARIDRLLDLPKFPKRSSQDPDRRRQRVRGRAKEAPGKKYETKPRSVRSSQPNRDKVTYLHESYTNDEERLVCQICQEEMPFKKRNGQYYFEAVEIFNDLGMEHAEAHAALCPLCAAKFKEFVKRDPKQTEELRATVQLSEAPLVELEFGDEAATLRFVDNHLVDLQALLDAESNNWSS